MKTLMCNDISMQYSSYTVNFCVNFYNPFALSLLSPVLVSCFSYESNMFRFYLSSDTMLFTGKNKPQSATVSFMTDNM